MPSTHHTAPVGPRLVKLWFWLDAVVALAPPLYWAADGATTPVLGVPAALFYFLFVGVFVSASVIFACVAGADERAAS